ncbi:MAG: transglutaminase-like domain-containing protein [Pseudomonadota bacterium]
MRTATLLLAALAFVPSAAPATPTAITALDTVEALAREIVGTETDPLRQTRLVVDWLNAHFTWNATDYEKRSVAELIAQRGGNCAEQMRVARSMLTSLGVKTRRMAEINLQPFSEQRGLDAAEQIAKVGVRASVFGAGYNDHRWLEVYDAASEEWVPADPTLGLVGLDQWEKARVSFGARPVHAIIPSRDMIVPVAVFAMEDEEGFARVVDRSHHYLVDGFAAQHEGRVATDPDWVKWQAAVDEISPAALAAFRGQANLLEKVPVMERAGATYAAMRTRVNG